MRGINSVASPNNNTHPTPYHITTHHSSESPHNKTNSPPPPHTHHHTSSQFGKTYKLHLENFPASASLQVDLVKFHVGAQT